MPAYRAKPTAQRPERARPTELVSEMIEQFASPYAFARELVQNSIDAGATQIEVRCSYDGVFASTSFTDNGSGMSPSTIQERLLTLFSSTKEDSSLAIGKYGVGFVSVLGVKPALVRVVTNDGTTHSQVDLKSDHSFQLSEAASAAAPGTQVELLSALEPEAYQEHVQQLELALGRWCRHVDVPIDVWVGDVDQPRRLNEPFEVGGLVSISREIDGQRLALGLSFSDKAHGAFYNRGLLLEQLDQHGIEKLSRVHFKVSSPKLGHTISRDQVRRDAEYHAVVRQLIRLAETDLRACLAGELAQAAERVSRALAGGEALPESVERYNNLLVTALCSVQLPAKQVVFAWCATRDQAGTVSLAELQRGFLRSELWCVAVVDEMARALVARGERLLYAPDLVGKLMLTQLMSKRELKWVEEQMVQITLLQPEAHAEALLEALLEALGSLGHSLAGVRLCRRRGAALPGFAWALPQPEDFIAKRSEVHAWAAAVRPGETLYLDAEHEVVRVALHKVRSQRREVVDRVAELLVRLLLLDIEGPLRGAANDRLLGHFLGTVS